MNNINSNSSSRAQGLRYVEIVGELHLSDCHYRIVMLGNPVPPPSLYPEIQRFQINGQHFALVKGDPQATAPDPTELLTERELQIATLVALGRLNKQIACQLHISEWTVATHLRRIFAKLGVDTRSAMVYRCAKLIGRNGFDQVGSSRRPA